MSPLDMTHPAGTPGESADLIALYSEMHGQSDEMFAGWSILPHLPRIRKLIEDTGAKTLLDYGSGKGKPYELQPFSAKSPTGTIEAPSLADYFGVAVTCYDPAWPAHSDKSVLARQYDVAIATDVLEHANDEVQARWIIGELFRRSGKGVFASISCIPAQKTLPDGRNCHTLIREPKWWANLFRLAATPEAYGARKWKVVCRLDQTEYVFSDVNPEGLQAPIQNGPPVFDATPGRPGTQIETRNPVPKEQIQAQIRETDDRARKLSSFKYVAQCHPHRHTAVLVSGGKSWGRYLDEIRERHARGDIVFCVKSTHDWLIKAGIVPYGCFLLDPRPLVGDFISKPHPQMNYFTATMCHRSVIDVLAQANAKVWLYHAAVGSEEEKVAKQGVIVGGGSCAAMRGLQVLRTIGFRRIRLYGVDSCYTDEPPPIEGYEGAHFDKDRVQIQVGAKRFLSDGQLAAQVRDFQLMTGQALLDCEIEVIGDGAIAAVVAEDARLKQATWTSFEKLYL